MLTAPEQAEILRKVDSLLSRQSMLRTRVERHEVSPKAAKDSMASAKDELKDFLKEVG